VGTEAFAAAGSMPHRDGTVAGDAPEHLDHVDHADHAEHPNQPKPS
jgi:hypothetical protein